MCNLYSVTKGQKAIRDLANAMIDKAGNMLSVPGVVPNRVAPLANETVEDCLTLVDVRSVTHVPGR